MFRLSACLVTKLEQFVNWLNDYLLVKKVVELSAHEFRQPDIFARVYIPLPSRQIS